MVGMALGISCAQEDECTPGYEACICSAGTCLAGLSCLSGYCVDPNWEPTGDGAAEAGTPSADDTMGSGDNVAACNALIDEIECGMFDLSGAIDCSLYSSLTCDIADYFDCIRDAFTCTDGVPDTSGIIDCAELATCT